jgi:AcrR family transcriptional regulator
VTVSPRERLPTMRGRQTQAAIDAAARAVVARKGFLATRIVNIAVEAGQTAASFYNYYDSKESMVRECDDPKLTVLALVSMLVDDEAGPT